MCLQLILMEPAHINSHYKLHQRNFLLTSVKGLFTDFTLPELGLTVKRISFISGGRGRLFGVTARFKMGQQ